MNIIITLPPETIRDIAYEAAAILKAQEKPKLQSLTVSQFAERTNISADSVRRRVKAGVIRSSKNDGIIRIPSTEIERFFGITK